MNAADRKQLEIAHLKLDDVRQDIVEFEINESGQVENPVIRKSFEFSINNTIIDKVMMLKFKPALQNGRPVRVRYKVPILFK